MSLIEDSKHLRIPFEDIKDATQNFTTLIGRGGYGPVYRGQLSLSGEPMVVAIKRLQSDHRSGQGLKEFLTEIQLLSRYKHPNLVSLVGFCEELNEKFLIYEYAEHGSLDNYLYQVKKRGLLTWRQRINICIDAARGLDHLHYGVAQNQRVIHRDIKSANILLDHNRKAVIADFGLSKIGRANENDTYIITNASGTHGYCDPAYIRTGILTKESDVYSFGVVLFEVLCGRLCFMNVDSEERFLAPLAQRYYKEGKLNLIIDRDLKNYMNSDSMKVFSEVAFHCLNDDRKLRPSMNLVLKKLEIALSLLDKEEAPELLELEEALEMRKLVESLQIQQFEEACEVQELQEALGLHKLVETLQLQQFKEEAWKFQEHLEHPQCGFDNDCNEIEELSASEDVQTYQEISDYDSRSQIATFHEPGSSVMVQYESGYDESVSLMPERPHANPNIKKGLCHWCLKGNRFTMKESCIVCDAKYCSKCVLKVMGSMPEGRKCITCIGHPIEESKRGQLGKRSRVLKQVLTDFEVEQVMLAEKSCQANQAPHWLIVVNGRHLSLEEMYQLKTCSHPPKQLVPGSYWYDKLSGFWGEEGRKPSQIIMPGLSIGGDIMENASKGSTNVKFNGRVITKRELLMLKLAGINHKGSPHYWVGHNGTYQEGHNQQIGKIWEKLGIKMACVLLSLPMPPKSFITSDDTKPLTKILLVGQDQSGISAIYKQAKILYRVPFSEDERQKVKSLIQRNLYLYISILLEGLKQFEEDYSIQIRRKPIDQPSTSAAGSLDEDIKSNIYSLTGNLDLFSEWLLKIVESDNLEVYFPAATREYSAVVEKLWKDKAFQATYARRDELPALPIVADYFLPRAAEISSETYEPSDEDILYADGITSSNGITSMEFSISSSLPISFVEATEQNNSLVQRYKLIRVNSSNLGYNCKWLDMFEDVDLVFYCVDLTSYNEFFHDNNLNLKNKMLESKHIFENIVTHQCFKNKAFLLILNKFDLLEKKIKTIPLTQCEWFHDFNPFITNHSYDDGRSNTSNNASVAQYAFQYIAAKFKKSFTELTGRKLYVSPVTGLEGGSVDAAFKYGKEVLMWVNEENRAIDSTNEWSSFDAW